MSLTCKINGVECTTEEFILTNQLEVEVTKQMNLEQTPNSFNLEYQAMLRVGKILESHPSVFTIYGKTGVESANATIFECRLEKLQKEHAVYKQPKRMMLGGFRALSHIEFEELLIDFCQHYNLTI